jgi:hypothetical protein
MDYFGGIDSAYDMAKTASRFGSVRTDRGSAAKEFASLFYSEMMKQALGAKTGVFSAGEGDNYFGNVTPLSDVFMDQFVREMINKTGLDMNLTGGISGTNKRY